MRLKMGTSSIAVKIQTAVMILVMTACAHKPNDASIVYDLEPEGWPYGKIYKFTPESADSNANGNLSILLRHSNQYPYSDLWLEINVTDSLSSTTDTLHFDLADEAGRWKGHGTGADFQLSNKVYENLTLHKPVTISLRHIMRDSLLEGIEQIGISFAETIH